jgi:hypothetical protein
MADPAFSALSRFWNPDGFTSSFAAGDDMTEAQAVRFAGPPPGAIVQLVRCSAGLHDIPKGSDCLECLTGPLSPTPEIPL